jgi:hypothetical protein
MASMFAVDKVIEGLGLEFGEETIILISESVIRCHSSL